MFDCPVYFSSVLLFLQRLAFVILLLASTEGDVHLGTTVLVDEDERRHDSITRQLLGFLQLVNLASGEQKLAVALSFMVGV